MNQEWSPRLTVATIIERDGRFLLVEEYADGEELVYNHNRWITASNGRSG